MGLTYRVVVPEAHVQAKQLHQQQASLLGRALCHDLGLHGFERIQREHEPTRVIRVDRAVEGRRQ